VTIDPFEYDPFTSRHHDALPSGLKRDIQAPAGAGLE
jgi:hypothetical protein